MLISAAVQTVVFCVKNMIIFHFQFHRKSLVSVTFLSHWIEQHIPRLIVGIHRYILHVLSTAYREAGQLASAVSTRQILPLLLVLLPLLCLLFFFPVVPQPVFGTLTTPLFYLPSVPYMEQINSILPNSILSYCRLSQRPSSEALFSYFFGGMRIIHPYYMAMKSSHHHTICICSR